MCNNRARMLKLYNFKVFIYTQALNDVRLAHLPIKQYIAIWIPDIVFIASNTTQTDGTECICDFMHVLHSPAIIYCTLYTFQKSRTFRDRLTYFGT